MRSWLYVCPYCGYDIKVTMEGVPPMDMLVMCTHCERKMPILDLPLVMHRTSLGDGPLPVIYGDQPL